MLIQGGVRWHSSLVGLLASVAAVPLAFAGPPARFEQVARSGDVTYWAEKGHRVDVARSEAFLERLGTLFTPPPGGWHIQFYLHASATDLRERIGYPVAGLTDMSIGRIDSVRAYHPHELVHAVAGRLGVPPPFFSEGLAVALTSGGRWQGEGLDDAAARAMAERSRLEPFLADFGHQEPAAAYAVAGSFVAFLLDRQGIEPMKRFLRGCGTSPSRFEHAFRLAYGRSVASLTIEWMASLSRGETGGSRAWYDAARWPAALRRGAEPPAIREASAGPSPSEAALRAEPSAAEGRSLAR